MTWCEQNFSLNFFNVSIDSDYIGWISIGNVSTSYPLSIIPPYLLPLWIVGNFFQSFQIVATKPFGFLFSLVSPVSCYSEPPPVIELEPSPLKPFKCLNIGKASKIKHFGRMKMSRGESLCKNLVHLWQKSLCLQEKSVKNP